MFHDLIRKRRSIRKFLNKKIEEEKIQLLIEAALRSPSSMGNNPWEFIVVKDQTLLEKLSRAKEHGSSFLKDAALAVIVCADQSLSNVWIEDAAIASIFLHLAAESLGLGSCWIQIRERKHSGNITSEAYISGLLGIPERLRVEAVIAMGYPGEQKPPHPESGLEYRKISLDHYSTHYRSEP